MIKIITLSIFISISLFARLNPFEADPKMSVTTKKLEPIKVENVSSMDDGNRTVHLQSQETMNVAVKKEKIIIKEKVIKLKPTKEEIAAQCKIVEKKKIIKIVKPKPIVKKFVPAAYKVLPFLTVDVDYKDLKLTSRTKYNIVTYHNLKDSNKVAFDFFTHLVQLFYQGEEYATRCFKLCNSVNR